MSQIIEEDTFDFVEMVGALESYYESAGFADFHSRVLKDMDEDQIREFFHETFYVSEDYE